MRLALLSNQDSNLDRQNQNLKCYHYTIGQSVFLSKAVAKILLFIVVTKKNTFKRRQQKLKP